MKNRSFTEKITTAVLYIFSLLMTVLVYFAGSLTLDIKIFAFSLASLFISVGSNKAAIANPTQSLRWTKMAWYSRFFMIASIFLFFSSVVVKVISYVN